MLEIRHVTKTYRSKTGESVKALDDISVAFPETGMVFILGKSGSGKSTLLNAIGGLDSIDSGEFVIMGKSSKDFVGSDFDAYRNTFIGFIFQEYNVLDEFTVGANIALALELQGKKATDETINDILSKVDLLHFAKRKPNELSGGQKQRVAIARALVKDPQIIMADEPTGALDSNTGKQIFDTLKELSKEKLVLIVSHDRDFAERYADRIIELADGHIISDVTKHEVEGRQLNGGIKQIGSHILQVKGGYRLTPEDVEMINAYLATSPDGLMISGDNRVNSELRSAAGITEDGGTKVFEGTDAEKDVPLKAYDGRSTKFIRSRLPMKNAVRMGASGLKHKKFRLVLTILLSLVAFGMFGLADTMAAYDKVTAATESILDTNTANASVSLGVRHTYIYDDSDSFTYYNSAAMNDADIAYLEAQTGLDFVPVFNGNISGDWSRSFTVTDMMASNDYRCEAYEGQLYGFTCLSAEDISKAGLTLVGRMPQTPGEIVISEFMYRQFNLAGFTNTKYEESVPKEQLTMEPTGAKSIIGKHLNASKWFDWVWDGGTTASSFVIVGVVDTKFDYDRYAAFLPQETNSPTNNEADLTTMLLQIELQDTLKYGFHTLGFVCEEDINSFSSYFSKGYRQFGTYIGMSSVNLYSKTEGNDANGIFWINRMAGSETIGSLNVTWVDGTPRTTLAANEYLIHKDFLQNRLNNIFSAEVDLSAIEAKAAELYGESWTQALTTAKENNLCYYDTIRQAIRAQAGGSAKTDDEINAEIKNTFLPLVAALYGVTPSAHTPDEAKEELLQILYTLMPGQKTLDLYQVTNTLGRFYCWEDIAANDLLSNENFCAMVKTYLAQYNSGDEFSALPAPEQARYAVDAYHEYLRQHSAQNAYGDKTYEQIEAEGQLQYLEMIGMSVETLLDDIGISVRAWDENGEKTVLDYTDWKVVGFFDDEGASDLIVSDTFVSDVNAWKSENNYVSYKEECAEHEDGIWAFAIAAMPKDRATVEKLVSLSYAEGVDLRFSLQNQVMNTLGTFNDFIETGAKVFLYIGIGFAVFSALLLMNFISVSISYKKREIGILRAVGARSSDVFKIFFSESLIIALINFVLAVAAALTAIFFLNRWMYTEGINITLLNFGIRQLGLMLLVSVGVAALASFLPVWHIARKKPVDAIKDR